jgi:uncharacterized protein (DUF1499 family)
MKIITIIFISLFLSAVVYLYYLGIKSQSGHAPGLVNNKLSRCPDTPNCINSEYIDHTDHYVTAIKYSMNKQAGQLPLDKLHEIILQMGGTIEYRDENYISATFTSTIFRFVDDLEARLDKENNLIHLRSASRVGRSDLGKNKERVEIIKAIYNKQN